MHRELGGVGSCFTLYLPPLVDGSARERKVLIVDDDPGMCDTLAAALSRRGSSSPPKTSALEAAHVTRTGLRRRVTDCTWTHGRIRVLRARGGDRPTCVVVITAFGTLETAVPPSAPAPTTSSPSVRRRTGACARRPASTVRARRGKRCAQRARLTRDDRAGGATRRRKLADLVGRWSDTDGHGAITARAVYGRSWWRAGAPARPCRAAGPSSHQLRGDAGAILESSCSGTSKARSPTRARRGRTVPQASAAHFSHEIGDLPIGMQPKSPARASG